MSIKGKIHPVPKRPKIVLVLQGGGALGAYHIGAYQALQEYGFEPDWVSGISIGAINSALIVGNGPDHRLDRLWQFWNRISRPDGWGNLLHGSLRRLFNTGSNAEALMLGQPGFFSPRIPNPYFAPAGSLDATSFYDTSPLLETLAELSSFERINSKQTRLSLGATNLRTGNLIFFDNTHQEIASRHVAASGSLPPGFPAQEIDGELYWDGGCVSNTPLEAVLTDEPDGHTVVFLIDLWPAAGAAPRTIDDVLWRQKQIQYASRTAQHIDAVATKLNLRHEMMQRRTGGGPVDPAVSNLTALTDGARLDIVHVIYQPTADQIPNSDAEFSRPSIQERYQAGLRDVKQALAAQPWLTPKPEPLKALIHRVEGGRVATQQDAHLKGTGEAAPNAKAETRHPHPVPTLTPVA